jgi:hypothetical protein
MQRAELLPPLGAQVHAVVLELGGHALREAQLLGGQARAQPRLLQQRVHCHVQPRLRVEHLHVARELHVGGVGGLGPSGVGVDVSAQLHRVEDAAQRLGHLIEAIEHIESRGGRPSDHASHETLTRLRGLVGETSAVVRLPQTRHGEGAERPAARPGKAARAEEARRSAH